ncbi:hypothetical protein WJX77_012212 [Trebouxia sp. C0004]
MPTNRTTKAAGRLARTFGQRAHVYDFTNFRQGPRRFVSLYSWTSLSYARSLSGTNVWCFHFASHFNSSFSREALNHRVLQQSVSYCYASGRAWQHFSYQGLQKTKHSPTT